MAQPYERYVGTYTGDGAAKTLTIGFKPAYIRVLNFTDRIEYEKYNTMAAADTLKTVAAGTRTLETGSDIVLTNKGATISLGANINAKVFHVFAVK